MKTPYESLNDYLERKRKMLGRVLRERRTRLGLAQELVARVGGVSRSTVSHAECGKRGISVDNLEGICFALEGASVLEVLAERDRRLLTDLRTV